MVDSSALGVVGRPVREEEGRARPVEAARASARAEVAGAAVRPEAARFRGTRPATVFSPTTAVYDRFGAFPHLFLFQIAHPRPPRPPFEGLYPPGPGREGSPAEPGAERLPEPLRRSIVGGYAPPPPRPGGLVEALA